MVRRALKDLRVPEDQKVILDLRVQLDHKGHKGHKELKDLRGI
jgi:hypothetical protein